MVHILKVVSFVYENKYTKGAPNGLPELDYKNNIDQVFEKQRII